MRGGEATGEAGEAGEATPAKPLISLGEATGEAGEATQAKSLKTLRRSMAKQAKRSTPQTPQRVTRSREDARTREGPRLLRLWTHHVAGEAMHVSVSAIVAVSGNRDHTRIWLNGREDPFMIDMPVREVLEAIDAQPR